MVRHDRGDGFLRQLHYTTQPSTNVNVSSSQPYLLQDNAVNGNCSIWSSSQDSPFATNHAVTSAWMPTSGNDSPCGFRGFQNASTMYPIAYVQPESMSTQENVVRTPSATNDMSMSSDDRNGGVSFPTATYEANDMGTAGYPNEEAMTLEYEEQIGDVNYASANPDALWPDVATFDQDFFQYPEEPHVLTDTRWYSADLGATSTTSYRNAMFAMDPRSLFNLQDDANANKYDTTPNNVGPWSAFNRRDDQSVLESMSPKETQIMNDADALRLPSTGLNVRFDKSSVPGNNLAMSPTAFDNDVNHVMGSTSILCTNVNEYHQIQHPMDPGAYLPVRTPPGSLSTRHVAMVTRPDVCVREGTPAQDPKNDNLVQDVASSWFGQHPGSLCVPSAKLVVVRESSPARCPSRMSVSSSLWSATSPSVPPSLSCDEPGCNSTFTGEFRKGNLARHKRRKHRGIPGEYLCQQPCCRRSFNRSDARLKHYRSHHPDLAPRPIEYRPKQHQGRRSH